MKEIIDNFEKSYKGGVYTDYNVMVKARAYKELKIIERYYRKKLVTNFDYEWALDYVKGFQEIAYRLEFCEKLIKCVLGVSENLFQS